MGDQVKNYALTLNEEQAKAVAAACELMMRLALGQTMTLGELLHGVSVLPTSRPYPEPTLIDMEELTHSVRHLTQVVTGTWQGNASWGIGSANVNERARVVHDVMQVIRHRLAWDANPAGGWTVNYDTPMKFSGQPLPEIRQVMQPAFAEGYEPLLYLSAQHIDSPPNGAIYWGDVDHVRLSEGWLVYVTVGTHDVPEWFKPIFEEAQENHTIYVLFDQDGDVLPRFKTYLTE